MHALHKAAASAATAGVGCHPEGVRLLLGSGRPLGWAHRCCCCCCCCCCCRCCCCVARAAQPGAGPPKLSGASWKGGIEGVASEPAERPSRAAFRHRLHGHLVLQGTVALRTSQSKHILRLLARKRLGTRWAKYPFSWCQAFCGPGCDSAPTQTSRLRGCDSRPSRLPRRTSDALGRPRARPTAGSSALQRPHAGALVNQLLASVPHDRSGSEG